MNRNGLYMGVMVTIILAIILYASYGMLNVNQEPSYYSVSVIVEDSSNDRWNAFKEGLEQGASEHRIYLDVVSVTELSGWEEEEAVLQREIDNGADGVIIEVYDSEDVAGSFSATLGSTAAVLVGTGMNSLWEASYTVVATDAFEVGKAIAGAALEELTENDSPVTVGLLTGNQKRLSMQDRLSGFTETIADTDMQILWCLSDDEISGGTELAALMEQNTPDILVALENDALEYAIDYLLSNPAPDCRLYGEGRSEKTVYYLDKGLISAMVVVDEYSMGYQCVSQIAAQLEDHNDALQTVTIDFLTVTPDEMYSEDMEKIVFPVI